MDENRLARVRDNMGRRGLAQALIVDPLSIWWLCGYYTEPYERFLALLVPAEGEPAPFAHRLFPAASRSRARAASLAPSCSQSRYPVVTPKSLSRATAFFVSGSAELASGAFRRRSCTLPLWT